MDWEEILKGAILKPKVKPPEIKRKIKTKTPQKVSPSNEPEPEDEFDVLHEKCKCDMPLCKRIAKFGCVLCGAMLCKFHKAQIADNRVKIDSAGRETSAAHIHSFAEGKCEGGEFVNPDGSDFGRRSWS